MSTPLEIAKEYCANYEKPQGGCKRIIIANNGAMVRRLSMPEFCVLSQKGERCAYFEDTVLPFGKTIEPTRYPKRRAEFLEGEHQYRMETGAMTDKKTARCPCGNMREPRHRFCPECAAKRRHDTFRRSQAQKRGLMSTVKPISDPENKGF